NRPNLICRLVEFARIAFMETKLGGQDDPVLAVLENTLAILEPALIVTQCAYARAVSESNLFDQFLNRASVGARIAVYCAAEISGDAGHGLEALHSEADAVVHNILENSAALDPKQQAIAKYVRPIV